MKIELNNIELILLSQKALYLPEYHILCIADWHLGKAAHLRKSGIPLPQHKPDPGFAIIEELCDQFSITKILFLGDLFHSIKNNEWESFRSFISQLPAIEFILVKGNHDIIPDKFFNESGIKTTGELILDDKLCFTHHPLFERTKDGFLNIAGHIHPGCLIEQKAKQIVRLPCFYYRDKTLVLPSFGSLTGLQMLPQKMNAIFYCIAGNHVFKLADAV
ncbi:MAG: ligase-associated DNA damage response endonuclease PdeM [Arachidicoccus sp.]|nr:ligase-associated DNA damage response endonuclease PdeM [Arachidicoccus sp.]